MRDGGEQKTGRELTPTMEDVARAAGVALSTVSLALRDDPKVKASTKERIREVAERMGYARDPLMSRLARYRWEGRNRSRENLVYLTDYPDKRTRYPWLLPAAKAQAEASGFDLEAYDVNDFSSPRRLSEILYHRGIRGILLAPVLAGRPLPKMDWDKFAVIASDEGHADLPFHSVRPNYREGMRLVWTRMTEQGCERLGFALMHMEWSSKASTPTGEYLFLETKQYADRSPIPVLYGNLRQSEDCKQRLRRWIDAYQPDGILGINDAVHWQLREMGFRMPEDIRYASAISSEAIKDPTISGARYPWSELGPFAIRILEGLIRDRETGIPPRPLRHLVPALWHEGNTHGDRKSSHTGESRRAFG